MYASQPYISIYQCSKNQFWKQITTQLLYWIMHPKVFINVQRTNFESKSQLISKWQRKWQEYLSMFKEPILKANHNVSTAFYYVFESIYQCSKNQFWKQITTAFCCFLCSFLVFINVQRTNFESKSQLRWNTCIRIVSIYQCSKNQFWKQITTNLVYGNGAAKVFINVQRTNFESKSQLVRLVMLKLMEYLSMFKEPILKANHNSLALRGILGLSIYQCSKNQFWKQITTLKPNGNQRFWVFINVQRTNFESKSQQDFGKAHLDD